MKHFADQSNLFSNMEKSDKRYPALKDEDLMPFGKYEGRPMQDIPNDYLIYLWEAGCHAPKVANYIWNSKDSINQDKKELAIQAGSFGIKPRR